MYERGSRTVRSAVAATGRRRLARHGGPRLTGAWAGVGGRRGARGGRRHRGQTGSVTPDAGSYIRKAQARRAERRSRSA